MCNDGTCDGFSAEYLGAFTTGSDCWLGRRDGILDVSLDEGLETGVGVPGLDPSQE
jgi:hypothetical protein